MQAESLKAFGADIKFSHTLFALPFAGMVFFLAENADLSLKKCLGVLLCMVFARTFAMGMNRYLDKDIDALNPRTQNRAIPAQKIHPTQTLFFSLVCGALFVVSTLLINDLTFTLSLPLLVILATYSLMKRVSFLCHWYLGLSIGLSPVAVAIALSDSVNLQVVALSLGMMFWIAGFDIIYASMDIDFDRSHRVKSIPEAFGIDAAYFISKLNFFVSILFFTLLGFIETRLSSLYFIGVGIAALLLVYEHWLVRRRDAKIDLIFFQVNASLSVILFVFVALARLF